LLAFLGTERTKEIGVRTTLGAQLDRLERRRSGQFSA
jgi:hypothetical protein